MESPVSVILCFRSSLTDGGDAGDAGIISPIVLSGASSLLADSNRGEILRSNANYIADLDQNERSSGRGVVLEQLLTDDSFIRSAMRKFYDLTKNYGTCLLITIVILTSRVIIDHGTVITIITGQGSDKRRRSKYLEKLIRQSILGSQLKELQSKVFFISPFPI